MVAILLALFLGLAPRIAIGASDDPSNGSQTPRNPDEMALAECERQLPACPDLGPLLHNLAARFRSEHRYAEARPLYERAVEIAERVYGSAAPRVARALNGLALIQRDMREYGAAEETANHALSLLSSLGLGRTADAADAFLVLGTALEGERRLDEARSSFEKAASIREQLFGGGDPLTAEAWSNLGLVYRNEAKPKRAEAFYRAALAVLEKQDPQRERPVLLNNLARARADQGRWKDAAQYYRMAIAAWETTQGVDHPDVALGLTNLAALLVEHHGGAEAESLMERALAISRRKLAPGDPEIGRELALLGRVRAARGDNAAAAELYSRGIRILATAWGMDDPRLLPWLDTYSRLLHAREEYAEAERVRLQATRIRVVNTLRNSH